MNGPVESGLPGRRVRTTFGTVLTLLAVFAAGCSSAGTPQARLSAALESRFEDPFAFEVTVEADRASLNELGDGAQAAAEFLQGLRIRGVYDDNEAFGLDVSAFGIADLAQLLVFGTDGLYVRAKLDEFSAAAATEPLDIAALTARLEDADVDPAVITAARRFVAGDWIGLTGLEDEADPIEGDTPAAELDLDAARQALADAFGPDVESFVTRFLTLRELEVEGETRWDATLDLGALVVASSELNAQLGLGTALPTENLDELLGGLPSSIPGSVVVRDGALAEVVFDLRDAEDGVDPSGTDGTVLISVTFEDDPAVLEPPADVEQLTLEQLNDAVTRFVSWQAREALRQLQESFEELSSELATESTS